MRFLLPAALATALAVLPAAAQQADGLGRHVAVTGTAEVEAVPDRATITAGADTRGETAAEALAANSALMTEVFAALEAAGVARADMQTSNLSLGAVWDNGRDGSEAPRVVGYEASNMVTISLRDVARLGAVIDAATTAGANRLYGVSFEVADPRTALDDARTRAVADARAKAELYAGAAGVSLGQVLTIRETDMVAQPFFARAEAASAAPPVAEGTVSLRADVEVVFALE
jgi:uncharacterized protein YggE